MIFLSRLFLFPIFQIFHTHLLSFGSVTDYCLFHGQPDDLIAEFLDLFVIDVHEIDDFGKLK